MDAFTIKDLENVSLILAMEVSRDRVVGTLNISQVNCSRTILEIFGFSDCKSVNTPGMRKPLELGVGLLLDQENKALFQEIVGSLIYPSTCTRWDTTYMVMQLTRAMNIWLRHRGFCDI